MRFLEIHRQSHQRALKTRKSGSAKEKSDDKQTFIVDDDLLLFIKLNLLAYTLSLPCCGCFLLNKPLMHQVMTRCLSREQNTRRNWKFMMNRLDVLSRASHSLSCWFIAGGWQRRHDSINYSIIAADEANRARNILSHRAIHRVERRTALNTKKIHFSFHSEAELHKFSIVRSNVSILRASSPQFLYIKVFKSR